MTDISNELMMHQTMPVLVIPKIGYDNTMWSDEKRVLTIGTKTVQISPDSSKKDTDLCPICGYG